MLERTYTLLIGSYSDTEALAHRPHGRAGGQGIYTVRLDGGGRLSLAGVTEALNPAVLIPHPNGRVLYAIVETIRDRGEVLRYRVGDGGALTFLDSFRASGRSTCYLGLSPRADAAIVISYWDAMVDVADVDEDGRLGAAHQSFRQHHRLAGEWRQVTDREDHWTHRQVGPHAHCAHFWRDWVFIPDLGENAVFQYRYDPGDKRLVAETHVEFEAGSGPRHMAMHPTLDVCYVSNELFNTVCVARLDGGDPAVCKPRLAPVQYQSTIERRDAESYVSELTLSPDARFLYVSNRGDDSLAVFRVHNDGTLERIGLTPTGGRFPRHFAITPCGRAVVVANQDSSEIRLLARDPETGALEPTDETLALPVPNYVRFLSAR